jgi:hypothetical protein
MMSFKSRCDAHMVVTQTSHLCIPINHVDAGLDRHEHSNPEGPPSRASVSLKPEISLVIDEDVQAIKDNESTGESTLIDSNQACDLVIGATVSKWQVMCHIILYAHSKSIGCTHV